MIGVERLHACLQIVAASQYVINGMGPISINIIAPSDAGKTGLMLSTLPHRARVINDFTAASLLNIVGEPKPPVYLVVPDFNVAMSHKPTVANLAMALMLALIAEGITEIPGVDEAYKVRAKQLHARGLRFAFVTGMTPEMFYSRRGKWRNTGLLRRLVPINYVYSKVTEKRVQDSIANGGDLLQYLHSRSQHFRRRKIVIPESIASKLRDLSEHVTERQLVWGGRDRDGRSRVTQATEYPFSSHKVLRQLARSSALLNDRETVTLDDDRAVVEFSRFMRYDRAEEV